MDAKTDVLGRVEGIVGLVWSDFLQLLFPRGIGDLEEAKASAIGTDSPGIEHDLCRRGGTDTRLGSRHPQAQRWIDTELLCRGDDGRAIGGDGRL